MIIPYMLSFLRLGLEPLIAKLGVGFMEMMIDTV